MKPSIIIHYTLYITTIRLVGRAFAAHGIWCKSYRKHLATISHTNEKVRRRIKPTIIVRCHAVNKKKNSQDERHYSIIPPPFLPSTINTYLPNQPRASRCRYLFDFPSAIPTHPPQVCTHTYMIHDLPFEMWCSYCNNNFLSGPSPRLLLH